MSQLQANVLLNLPKEFNTLVLYYNTYEKATFDQYLSASIALRSKSYLETNKYIDDITGKGSLNEHFKHMVEETSKMDDASLQSILNNSMFPVTKIDKTNRYVYYPTFYIAVLNNRIYKNFVGKDIQQIKEELMLDYDLKKVEIDENSKSDKYESYKIRFINMINSYISDSLIKNEGTNIKRSIIDIKEGENIVITTVEGIVLDGKLYNILDSAEIENYNNEDLSKYASVLNKVIYTFKDEKLIKIEK